MNDDQNEINGYYDDDGTKLNSDLYPRPGLCLMCRFNDDHDEEILCNLNRLDQRNEKEFECGAYIPLRKNNRPIFLINQLQKLTVLYY